MTKRAIHRALPAHQTKTTFRRACPIALSLPEIRFLLEDNRLCRDFEPGWIDLLAHKFHALEAHTGALIFAEGEKESYLAIVAQGEVSVWKETASAEVKRIATIPSGYSFGEMSLIDATPRSATIRAEQDSVILTLSRNNFDTLRTESPHLALAFVLRIARLISLRLRQTSGSLCEYL